MDENALEDNFWEQKKVKKGFLKTWGRLRGWLTSFECSLGKWISCFLLQNKNKILHPIQGN